MINKIIVKNLKRYSDKNTYYNKIILNKKKIVQREQTASPNTLRLNFF